MVREEPRPAIQLHTILCVVLVITTFIGAITAGLSAVPTMPLAIKTCATRVDRLRLQQDALLRQRRSRQPSRHPTYNNVVPSLLPSSPATRKATTLSYCAATWASSTSHPRVRGDCRATLSNHDTADSLFNCLGPRASYWASTCRLHQYSNEHFELRTRCHCMALAAVRRCNNQPHW